jgi:hypothetical protein
MSEVGPVDTSTKSQLENFSSDMNQLTFRGPHKGVNYRRQPARHQPVLDRDVCNLGIGQALRNQHETQRKTRYQVANEPSRVISRQPADDGELVGQILDSSGRQGSGPRSAKPGGSVPSNVGFKIRFQGIKELHCEIIQDVGRTRDREVDEKTKFYRYRDQNDIII